MTAVEDEHGDPFDDFYAFDHARIVGAIAFVTGDLDVARDAVDEACARAFERIRRGAVVDNLSAWVRVVALNVARGRFRRRAVDRRARAALAAQADQVAIDYGVDSATVLDVRTALAQLPRRQREVCVWFYFLDCSVADVARELHTSEGNVKASLHRARLALAVLLGDDDDAQEVAP